MRPGALVPVLLLISSLAAAQQLGPEIPVSAPGQLFPTPSDIPRLASNGSGFLAVWHDGRSNGDVYAARLDARGSVLDPAGILLKHLAGSPAVASDGHDFLVAIADGCTDISVLRVAANGTAGELKQIATDGHVCSNVEIASNGDNYLVVWLPGNAALLDHDGNIISGPFSIGSSMNFFRLAIASNGRDYAAVGIVDNALTPVVTIPVSGHGDVGSVQSLFPSHVPDVAIASDGSGYLIAAASQNAVRAVRVGPDAVPVGQEVDEITAGTTFTPRVAWSGSQYVIGYVESRQSGTSLRFIDLDPNSKTFQSGAFISNVPLQSLIAPHDLVSSNGELLVAWTRGNETFVSLVSGADLALGQELSGTTLASAPVSQSGPLLISNGASTIAFWREGGSLLRAAVLSIDGRPLSPPVDIAQISDYHVAFAGSTVVATWRFNGNLYARRYTSMLQPIDADAVLIQNVGPGWQPYALAATNDTVLLVWNAPNSMTDAWDDVYGALVRTGSPTMTTTPVTIAQLPFPDDGVSVAWNGSVFLVAWAHALGPPPNVLISPAPPGPPNDVLGVRISSEGHVLDSTPITIGSLGGSTAAASNGHNFFVAWTNGSGIYGKTVGADGVVSADAPTQLSPMPTSVYMFSMMLVSGDGDYIVLWTLANQPYAYSIHFRMVDANGKAGGFTSLPQIERPSYGGGASLAITPAGIVVIYDRLAGEPQFAGVSRVFTRKVVPSAGRRRAIGPR